MTDEVKAPATAGSSTGDEKRYTDPYGLYRQWFNVLEEAWEGVGGDSVNSAELTELWRRWFETTIGSQTGATNAANGFVYNLAPLWQDMAEDISEKMLSGEALPEDPLRFFLRWYSATNEKWSKTADELLKKDEVLESISRFFETYARSHGEIRRASEEGLKNLRIPTRSDIARVAKLVVAVENKVDRIEEAFEEFIYGQSEPAAAGDVENLEKRMDRLEGKMDRILAVLEKIEAGEDSNPSGTSQGPTTKTPDKTTTPTGGYT